MKIHNLGILLIRYRTPKQRQVAFSADRKLIRDLWDDKKTGFLDDKFYGRLVSSIQFVSKSLSFFSERACLSIESAPLTTSLPKFTKITPSFNLPPKTLATTENCL